MENIQKVIKTQYMDDAVRGYSEYFFYDEEGLKDTNPVPGDRGLMRNGDLYFCWKAGQWDKIGE